MDFPVITANSADELWEKMVDISSRPVPVAGYDPQWTVPLFWTIGMKGYFALDGEMFKPRRTLCHFDLCDVFMEGKRLVTQHKLYTPVNSNTSEEFHECIDMDVVFGVYCDICDREIKELAPLYKPKGMSFNNG